MNSLCIAGLVLSPWYEVAGVLAVVRGACIGFAVAVWETMLMELVPENMLSRVVSLDFFGSFGLMPLGLALSAGIAGLAAAGDDHRHGRARLRLPVRDRDDAALAARRRLSREARQPLLL